MKKIKYYLGFLKKTLDLFIKFNGLKLSAALSYYTVFSIAPLLIIIISFAGIFFGKAAVEGKIYDQVKDLVGSGSAIQIQEIIRNIQNAHHGTLGSIIGFIILLIGASGVFSEIQESINYMWAVKSPARNGWFLFLKNKLWSFSLLGSMAFLLLVSLVVNAMIEILSERLKVYFAGYVIYLFYALNVLLIFCIICSLFAVIFKFLPDAVIRWRDAIAGALFTGFLFIIGKFIIGLYLGNSKVGLTYGVTASIVVLMLWVYYSSIILYFGAAFTKIYATRWGKGTLPKRIKPGQDGKKKVGKPGKPDPIWPEVPKST